MADQHGPIHCASSSRDEIGVTNTGGDESDKDFVGPRLLDVDLLDGERLAWITRDKRIGTHHQHSSSAK